MVFNRVSILIILYNCIILQWKSNINIPFVDLLSRFLDTWYTIISDFTFRAYNCEFPFYLQRAQSNFPFLLFFPFNACQLSRFIQIPEMTVCVCLRVFAEPNKHATIISNFKVTNPKSHLNRCVMENVPCESDVVHIYVEVCAYAICKLDLYFGENRNVCWQWRNIIGNIRRKAFNVLKHLIENNLCNIMFECWKYSTLYLAQNNCHLLPSYPFPE